MNTPDDAIAIDRLIDGELDENERRELLRRLDTTPDGWRRCALAFLEAQEFAQAARAWTSDHAAVHSEPTPVVAHPKHRRARLLRIATAAMLAGLAFASGFAAGERQVQPRVVQSEPSNLAPPGPFPETITPSPVIASPVPRAFPNYVQSTLARQGYRVEPARKLISLNLDSGRRVTIPVEGVEIQYVGRQTY
jgi:hypothetical protein